MIFLESVWELFFRTVLIYFLIIIVFRLMGKRELGELSIVDFVVFLLIAEIASVPLEDLETKLMATILPILFLLGIQVAMSVLLLKFKKVRRMIEGEPVLLINDGQIHEQAMRKERYNLDDLMQQLREQGVTSVRNVKYAFLEQSGKLSLFLKEDGAYVFPLILDGEIDLRHLGIIGKDERWLKKQLRYYGNPQVQDIFFCSYEDGELFIQLKACK